MSDPKKPDSPDAGEKSLGATFKGWFKQKPEEAPAAVATPAEPSAYVPGEYIEEPYDPLAITLPSMPALTPEVIAAAQAQQAPEPAAPQTQSGGFFERMKSGLSRTRSSFSNGMATLLIGGKEIDDELLEEMETQMLVADIGVEATRRIVDRLTERVGRNELTHSHALYKALQQELAELLTPRVSELHIDRSKKPYVILMVGINGVGKTTTIGKLAKRLQKQGNSVMLAAGDTFRAAAVEQLQVWGERNHIPVVAQGTGADSASVIFDALQSARARGVDVLIADTAGRLHTKSNLMEELKKVKRVMQKLDPEAPHEVMLVVDAGTGQNALNQVQEFDNAVGLTGLTITKLDGTAKGGVLFNIANRCNIPIRFIGVGEKIDDLRPFRAKDFVEALFEQE